jgi:hypothetical protein
MMSAGTDREAAAITTCPLGASIFVPGWRAERFLHTGGGSRHNGGSATGGPSLRSSARLAIHAAALLWLLSRRPRPRSAAHSGLSRPSRSEAKNGSQPNAADPRLQFSSISCSTRLAEGFGQAALAAGGERLEVRTRAEKPPAISSQASARHASGPDAYSVCKEENIQTLICSTPRGGRTAGSRPRWYPSAWGRPRSSGADLTQWQRMAARAPLI